MEHFIPCRDEPGNQALWKSCGSPLVVYGRVCRGHDRPGSDDCTRRRDRHREAWTCWDLSDAEAADRFAFEEPYYRAGRLRRGAETWVAQRTRAHDVGLRRCGGSSGGYLIIGHGAAGIDAVRGRSLRSDAMGTCGTAGISIASSSAGRCYPTMASDGRRRDDCWSSRIGPGWT